MTDTPQMNSTEATHPSKSNPLISEIYISRFNLGMEGQVC
jgi:hypothetical protein